MEGKVAGENRITEGSILGQLLLFFFPILLGTSFQQLYNTADAIVVDHFVGEQVLVVADGGTSTLINLLVGFFVGLSGGATVVIPQSYGARKADKVHWAVHTSITFSVVGGIILMIMGLVGSSWALETMKTPEDVMGHTVVCIRICFLGIIINLVYNMGAGVLRVVRDSRRPLYFLVASCFTNIILDALLVAVLQMEVADAALATTMFRLLSAVLVVRALMKTDDMYKPEWKKVCIDQRMLQRITRVSIPVGIQSVMHNISNVTIQAGVNILGADNVIAWTTYGKVGGLYWMMINALGISVTTFVGQNFGVGRLDHMCKGAGAHMVIGIVLTASMGVVLYSGGHLLMELFITDLRAQAISMGLPHFMAPAFITYIAIEILSGTLREAGNAWMPFVTMGIGVCAVRVLWTILVPPHYHTIIGAVFCYPLIWSLTMIASAIYYYFPSSFRRWRLRPLRKRFDVYKPS